MVYFIPVIPVLVAALAITGIFWLRRDREIDRLKRRYRQLTFASPKVAEEALRLQVVRLKNMAPGHTEKWYLERLIHELESGRLRHSGVIEK